MAFTSPISLFLAVLIAIALFVLAWIRRPALPRASFALAAGGIILLTLSAGGISCQRGREMRIAVMVDCSPSTRGAEFRDIKRLRKRATELLGSRPYDLYAFGETSHRVEARDGLAEMPADYTKFSPPPVDAVLLFSDGRFEAPEIVPPVDVILDAGLSAPRDAAIVDLSANANELAAEVRNSGNSRAMTWSNQPRQQAVALAGSMVLTTRLAKTTETITARLVGGDAWPENDALSIRPSPPMASQRWWVGQSSPRGWMGMSPANLPADASAWLGPALVVLNNVSADAIAPQQQDRLQQYVRDLGGAVLIIGGDRAFAAGHYPGSLLETLSPLASTAPEPVTHWVLLADSSGSMAAPAGSATRFKIACDALVGMLDELPKSDLVSIGSFARQLRWWSIAKNARDTSLLNLPPTDISAGGPTNLESALLQILASLPASPPIDLLVISDAETQIIDEMALAGQLKEHHIRLHALNIGAAKSQSSLQRLVESTGGKFLEDGDAAKWIADVRTILRAAMPHQMIEQNAPLTFSGAFGALPARTAMLMNRTWFKPAATSLATGLVQTDRLPAAAKWLVGAGEVMALAFYPQPAELASIERELARPPRDPRFRVTWHAGSSLHVRTDAENEKGYLNDQRLILAMGSGESWPIPQTAPGRYEIDLPAPRVPATATISHDAHVLDRFAVAGRYAREFESIGNDLAALRALAVRSGGRVIEPSQHGEIEFHPPQQLTSLAAAFAIVAVMLLGASLLAWRLS